MALKDEIEKIIKAEREKLEKQTLHHMEYEDRQRERFKPMRALLQEIAESIEPEFLRTSSHDHSFSLELRREGGPREISWLVRPNRRIVDPDKREEGIFEEVPGFQVHETVYRGLDDVLDKSYAFKNEQRVAEFLISKSARRLRSIGT